MKRIKTDLDEVRDIRRKRYLKHSKEYRELKMTITNRQIINSTQQGERLRVSLQYDFSSGLPAILNGIYVSDQSEADQKLIDVEPTVLIKRQESDAEAAEEGGDNIEATGEAGLNQIARQYLKRAMNEVDPYISLIKLKRANNKFTELGWTNGQIKSELGLTDNQWNLIKARYQYLGGVEAILIAYQDVINSEVMS